MKSWQKYINSSIAEEISNSTKYSDITIQLEPLIFDSLEIFNNIQSPKKIIIDSISDLPSIINTDDISATIFLNGNFNHSFDVQGFLLDLKSQVNRFSRLVVVAYNPYLKWLYKLMNYLGLRTAEVPSTFLTKTDLNNICKVSGFHVCSIKPAIYFPWSFFGVGFILNQLLPIIPVINKLSLTSIFYLRPIIPDEKPRSMSVVIPARNESGNIENAILRMPRFPAPIEIIFVEGNSTDDTWTEIQRIQKKYEHLFDIKIMKQTGRGKADAVRIGFSKAKGELLTILDADLTMPPELLPRFYNAFKDGSGDFINGTRLVYPMEGEAMRFLNHLGNIFFAKALSYVLGVDLGDSLCGTKLLTKNDYNRFISWRNDFGDFDPFGDFELLFPAATLNLGIVDIPIRYRARTYGTTNISRFSHGFMLLRMTLIGFFKIKI